MNRLICVALLGLTAPAIFGGCQTNEGTGSSAAAAGAPSISLTGTNKNITAGDTTTFIVDSRNTLGRNYDVRWTSTGGEITPEDNGRIARARFDQPGTYTVTANLVDGDRVISRSSTNVEVRPLR